MLSRLSDVSPAFSENSSARFCWFGVILYAPTEEPRRRKWIANEFRAYSRILDAVGDRYGAVGHWAKVETDCLTRKEREALQRRIRRRFGDKLDAFLELRERCDPKGILLNDTLRDCFAQRE